MWGWGVTNLELPGLETGTSFLKGFLLGVNWIQHEKSGLVKGTSTLAFFSSDSALSEASGAKRILGLALDKTPDEVSGTKIRVDLQCPFHY